MAATNDFRVQPRLDTDSEASERIPGEIAAFGILNVAGQGD